MTNPADCAAKRKRFKWRICLYRLWNLLLLCGIVNVGNVFSSDIDSISNFTTSFTGDASRDVDLKCAKNSPLITYRATNFNESNKISHNCEVEEENRVNKSENNQSRVHKIIERYPRQNARRKGKKVTEAKAPINSNVTNRARKRGKVSLLGLFELTSRAGLSRAEGRSELAAAELAVKHINERKLLKGYTLELITNDTQVSCRLLSISSAYIEARGGTL